MFLQIAEQQDAFSGCSRPFEVSNQVKKSTFYYRYNNEERLENKKRRAKAKRRGNNNPVENDSPFSHYLSLSLVPTIQLWRPLISGMAEYRCALLRAEALGRLRCV